MDQSVNSARQTANDLDQSIDLFFVGKIGALAINPDYVPDCS